MLAIGCDHAGFALKQELLPYFARRGMEIRDMGCYSPESVDYPDIAGPVARAVLSGACDRGVLICGTGIGISIAANRYEGIRCALCSDSLAARMTRSHNDANILALGGRMIGVGLAEDILDVFLNTPYEGGRHAIRVQKIDDNPKHERTEASRRPIGCRSIPRPCTSWIIR